eukprot:TRINITY_DN6320_c4_g1_i1.p1 TRINITY_DN6320_c4_g1~~TRINITY_DN6320_c4_g1_i1.p1  ORF type:complete len:464 (+),score=92.57 TRINITY_DN6320_c4_g1_i1:89-1480(+)
MPKSERVAILHDPDYSCSTEDDEPTDEESGQSLLSSAVPQRRTVASAFVFLAAVACGALAVLALDLHRMGSSSLSARAGVGKVAAGQLTARQLLEHPEVHDVVAGNLLSTQHEILGRSNDQGHVRRLVEENFRNLSQTLVELHPEIADVLDSTPITAQQKDAVVHAMRYLSDRRLQRLGFDVARIVRDARTDDPEVLKRHIAKKLGPRLGELRMLRAELFPDPAMRELLASGGGFEHLLHPRRIRFMRKVDDGWEAHFSMTPPELPRAAEVAIQHRRLGFMNSFFSPSTTPAPPMAWGAPITPQAPTYGYNYQALPVPAPAPVHPGATTTNHPLGLAETIVGLTGATLEEADALLRIIKPICKEFHHDLNVDPLVTSGIGAAAALFELTTCELNAATDNENPIEVVGCPLEYGSEGFDACRDLLTILGLLGDNDPSNGEQGNHNGETVIHKGIFDDGDKSPIR